MARENVWTRRGMAGTESVPQNGGLVDTIVLALAGFGAYHFAGLVRKWLRKSKPVHE